jgi:hypothetical protein
MPSASILDLLEKDLITSEMWTGPVFPSSKEGVLISGM